ncbi:MAG: LysR family transcriptional regulator [Proteobacteria bacterium]|nr:LysR family transcriptional regulator [Pseudomonadota bacterium]
MTFKQLEALYWIARLGGFAQAASHLHTSQSAISKRVRELEQLFDTELFDRTQRTARLTEKGEEMFVLASKLLEQRDAAVEQFGKPDVLERRIRLGVTELSAMTWLPRLVGLIQQHYPRVILEPDVDDSLQLRDKLQADELDLAIVPDTFADPRLPHKVIGQVNSAWMCKPGVVPAGGPVKLHELARHRMLVQGQNSGTGRAYDAWMKEQGVQPANVIVVSNLVALTGLTVSGLGVSYLPHECLQPLVTAGMLEVLDVVPALPAVRYVAMHKGAHRSALTSSIVALAQESCDFTRMFQAQMATTPPG